MKLVQTSISAFLGMTLSLSTYAANPVNVNPNFKRDANYFYLQKESSTPYKARVTDHIYNKYKLNKYAGVVTAQNGYVTLSEKGTGYWGQCVGFVKQTSNAKSTSNWTGSEKVSKDESLPAFTPIAVLNRVRSDGTPGYSNTDGNSHVGYYLRHYKEGILMLDQNHQGTGWNPVGKIYIRYLPFEGDYQYGAKNYYVLEQD